MLNIQSSEFLENFDSLSSLRISDNASPNFNQSSANRYNNAKIKKSHKKIIISNLVSNHQSPTRGHYRRGNSLIMPGEDLSHELDIDINEA